MTDTNQLPERLRKAITEIRRKPYPISDLIPLLSAAADALQARAQVQGEVCPTCGETEPYTGSCGTSNNDTKALCKQQAQATQAEVTDAAIDAATRHIYHAGRPTSKEYRVGIARAIIALRHERVPMTPRELDLIDGMIAVQLDHAQRCDAISNRAMAEKQKGWDMERVELLRRIRSFGISAQAKKGDE